MTDADFAHTRTAQEARLVKAAKLAARLRADGKTFAEVAAFTPDDRSWFERVCNVNRSSDETWGLVGQILADAEVRS